MKIAILGSRGIPASYGGFETFAEQLSVRLVEKGHKVMVYCCKPYTNNDNKPYKGVERVIMPAFRKKSLEKFFHAFLSLIDVCFRDFDIVIFLGISLSPLCFIPRLSGKKMVINIDGLEWQRKKWGKVMSRYLQFSEKMAGITGDIAVTDAECIAEYYKKRYGKNIIFIPYGADLANYPAANALKKLCLEPKEYILYVSRLDPENNALVVREAFDEIENPPKKLVIVGDAPFADSYVQRVKNTANPNIIFTGYLFGNSYKELQSNAFFYIQATEVGGTHPALLEAMGAGNCVLANDVIEHREVLGDEGIYYRGKDELRDKMIMLMQNDSLVREKGIAALRRVAEKYCWDKVVEDYERVLYKLLE